MSEIFRLVHCQVDAQSSSCESNIFLYLAENLTPSELKKLRNKQRKAQKKLEKEKEKQKQEQEKKEHIGGKKQQEQELDGPKEEDLVPEKLAKVRK